MSSVLGTEVPALNGTSKTFTFRGTGYVNFFNVSKQLNANVLTYGELFAFRLKIWLTMATALFRLPLVLKKLTV